VLNIAYLEMGDRSAPAVILVHGWSDAARGWWEVAEALDKSGWQGAGALPNLLLILLRTPKDIRWGKAVPPFLTGSG
jgi:pimeloyl-ACP methyl ester carboxylesterase